MFGFGYAEMIVVALIGFLLFGKRLPGTMKSVGEGIREFCQALRSTPPLLDDET